MHDIHSCIYIYTYIRIQESWTRRRTKNCSANFVTLSPVIHDEKFTLDVASITRTDGGREEGVGNEEKFYSSIARNAFRLIGAIFS